MNKKIAPGPAGTPIGGNLWKFRRNLFGLLEESSQKYGDVIRFRIFNEVFHMFLHPDQIKEILILKKNNFSRSAAKSSKVLEAIVGRSVLTLDGPEWVDRRKLISPVFGRNGLSMAISPMAHSAKAFMKKIKENQIYLAPKFNSELTAMVAGACFFGVEAKWDSATLESSLENLLKHHWNRIKSLFDLPHKLPTTSKRKFDAGMTYIKSIIENIINDESSIDKSGLIHKLKLLAKEDNNFANQNFLDESITFFLAGHETTATGLNWCLFMLSKYPEWQNKIRQEAIKFLSEEEITIEAIESMVETKAFFHEVLRLYPPVWLLERRVIEDVSIDGYELAKNTSVIFSVIQTHHHKDFWTNPKDFLPQRFLNTEIKNPAFMPFGAGGHSCIGQIFATLETVLCLGLLMKDNELIAVNPNFKPAFEVGITLRMKKPFEFKLKRI